MSTRDLLFRVLLISIVRFSTTSSSVIRPQSWLIMLSPEPTRRLESIPDRWKAVHPEFKAPQVELHLMKGHVSPNESWIFTNEYKYSGKDDVAAKMTSTTDEKNVPPTANGGTEERENLKENGVLVNNTMPDKIIPQIEFRNIITSPTFCPRGQRKDSRGRCRDIIT